MVKSEHYSQATIQALLDRLDGEAFLRLIDVEDGDYSIGENETRCYCPVCQDRSKMSLVLEADTRRAYCTNLYCQASNMNAGGGNLLEMFSLITGKEFDESIESLAQTMDIPLVKREGLSAQPEMSPESFQYVEVGHLGRAENDEGEAALKPAPISYSGQEGLGRGIIVTEDEVEGFVQKYRTDVYYSHFHYNIADKAQVDALAEQGKLPLLGDYYVAFNASSSAEIVHAINQAIDLVERLRQNYSAPYESVSVYYTNRHIEVHVDHAVFGITPTDNLHEIYRRMTCAIIGIDPLKPERTSAFSQLDLGVYRHDYLTNIPATLVSAGTREIYKIRMSYAAFKKMSYQRLHEFSLRRPDLPPREPWSSTATKAQEFFESVRTSLLRDTRLDESDTIASLFYQVSEQRAEIATLKQLAPTLLRRLFDESRHALATPSPHLNRALSGGFYPGQLYVIAGFPGSGTSTLVMELMNHVAAEQGTHSLFVGLQRGVEEVFKRSLASLGKIAATEIDEKRQNPTDLYEDKDFNRRIFAAYERYQQFADNITILEGATAGSLNQITRLIRDKKEELRSRTGPTPGVLLVVDSLQLMVGMIRSVWAERALMTESEIARELAQWDVSSLSSRLKALSRELDIAVLATFEHHYTLRNLASQLAETDPAYQQLLHDTQFADTAMVLSRQGASLLNLRDFFKTHLTGTPLEHRVAPITKKLEELEDGYRRTKEFEALRSEFAVLDIIKNRSGPCDKVLFVYHKPLSHLQPLEYLDGNNRQK